MIKSKGPRRPIRKYPFSELSLRILRRSIYVAPLFLCVLAGGIIYGSIHDEVFITVLFAAVGCIMFLEWLIAYLHCRKKSSRFALLRTSNDFPVVLVAQRANGLNVLRAESIYVRFFRNSELAQQYAAVNTLLLQRTEPKHLRQQAAKNRCTMEKISRGDSFPYAPIDLYDLKNKTILIARNVIEYYGKPDPVILAQNGCTLSVFDNHSESM